VDLFRRRMIHVNRPTTRRDIASEVIDLENLEDRLGKRERDVVGVTLYLRKILILESKKNGRTNKF
jgi:hypothetical protein